MIQNTKIMYNMASKSVLCNGIDNVPMEMRDLHISKCLRQYKPKSPFSTSPF